MDKAYADTVRMLLAPRTDMGHLDIQALNHRIKNGEWPCQTRTIIRDAVRHTLETSDSRHLPAIIPPELPTRILLVGNHLEFMHAKQFL